MSDSPTPSADLRNHPRLKVPPMYTLIRVTRRDQSEATMTGHIYDVSATGMRFELDRPIEPGTAIEARALLPGKTHTAGPSPAAPAPGFASAVAATGAAFGDEFFPAEAAVA